MKKTLTFVQIVALLWLSAAPLAILFLAPRAEAAAAISFIGPLVGNDDGSQNYSFPSQNLGTAAADRIILVIMHAEDAADDATMTIAGVSATKIASARDAGDGVVTAIYGAHVPTGTTGTIAFSFGSFNNNATISTFRVTGIGTSLTAYDTATDLDDAVSMSIDVPEQGILLAGAAFITGQAVTTVGVSEAYDAEEPEFSPQKAGGSAGPLSAEVNRTVSFDGGAGNASGVAVSFATQTEAGNTPSSLSKPPNNLGLVGYWSFNDATSTVATDFSGNGNTGSVSGATWTNGKRGKALQFDGVNDQVNAGSGAILDNLTAANVTVCAWVNPSSTQPDDDVRIVSKTNGSAFDSGWTFQFTNTAGASAPYTFQWRTRWTGGGTPGRWQSSSAVMTAAWQHMCVTYNGSSSTNDPVIYRNGSSIAITETVPPDGSLVSDASDSLLIGDVADGNRAFSGAIDEVRVYNRIVGAGEIAALARSGAVRFTSNSKTLTQGSSLESGLVGLWTFDGKDTAWTSTTAGTTRDGSGTNNIGTLTNMNKNSSSAIGKLGQAFNFNGSTQYIAVNDHASLDVTGSYSQVAWVKLNALPGGGNIMTVAGKGGGAPYMEFANDELSCGFNTEHTTGAVNLVAGVWYHVACVFDTTANTMTNYVNGAQALQEAENNNPADSSSELSLGRFPSGVQYLDGSIDDFRMYNRALTPAEVKQLYNLGKAVIRQ